MRVRIARMSACAVPVIAVGLRPNATIVFLSAVVRSAIAVIGGTVYTPKSYSGTRAVNGLRAPGKGVVTGENPGAVLTSEVVDCVARLAPSRASMGTALKVGYAPEYMPGTASKSLNPVAFEVVSSLALEIESSCAVVGVAVKALLPSIHAFKSNTSRPAIVVLRALVGVLTPVNTYAVVISGAIKAPGSIRTSKSICIVTRT